MISAPTAKYLFFGLVALAVLLEASADILLKRWATDARNVFLAVGLLTYFFGTVFWAFSLKYEFVSKAIAVFTILNLFAVVAVGVLYFKEDLSMTAKIGIGLGAISILLIELG